MIPIPKSWILYGAGAAVLVVFGLYVSEKMAHAATRSEYAEAERRHAVEYQAWAAATTARAEAVSEGLQRAQDEREQMLRDGEILRAAAASAESARKNDNRRASARIANLERENAKLAEWALTAVPHDYIRWMREPAEAAVPQP